MPLLGARKPGTCRGFSSWLRYVAIDSPDSPKYPLWQHFGVLRLIELANIHPSSSATGNLKHVSVRGAHFKYAILVAESFYWTFDLYGAIGCIDHRSLSRRKKDQPKIQGRERETKLME